MQDRYAGDVGDFGKLGFLRTAFGGTGAGLGVAWWLVPDETHDRVKNDGRHTVYLSRPRRFQHLDQELFRQLERIVREKRRSVSALRESALLHGAIHYDRRFEFGDITANSPAGRAKRATLRRAWVQDALGATAECDAVFLDPDNGVASENVEPHHADAPKYVFLDDLRAFLTRRQVVVTYHHAIRDGDHKTQALELVRLGRDLVGVGGYASAIRFFPYSPRFFLVLANQGQAADARRRVSDFMATNWSAVFDGPWEGGGPAIGTSSPM